MKWKNIDELPLNEQGVKKMIMLVKGKLTNDEMKHVCVGHWLVQKAENFKVESNETLMTNEEGYYGKMYLNDQSLELNKIIAWVYANELIDDGNDIADGTK